MTATIAGRVAAGAKFLDEHDPDWWRADVERAIDLDRLDLSQTDQCVLGQRCPLEVLARRVERRVDELRDNDFAGAYDAYVQHLSGLPVGGHSLPRWAAGLGFIASFDDDDSNQYPALTAEWARVIRERRSA